MTLCQPLRQIDYNLLTHQGLNVYGASIECASISGTFESATNSITKNNFGSKCLKLPISSINAKKNFVKKLVTLSKAPLIDANYNRRTVEVQPLNDTFESAKFVFDFRAL